MEEKKPGYRVCVLGATGLVGDMMIRILEERDFPVSELFPLASSRSVGKRVENRAYAMTGVVERTSAFWPRCLRQ